MAPSFILSTRGWLTQKIGSSVLVTLNTIPFLEAEKVSLCKELLCGISLCHCRPEPPSPAAVFVICPSPYSLFPQHSLLMDIGFIMSFSIRCFK